MSSRQSKQTRLAAFRDAFQSSLWPVPTAAIVLAVVAGILLPQLDAQFDSGLPDSTAAFLFGGGADAARGVLSAISGSLITATSLTFSLTVVALQLASSQFSPRLLRMFASDTMVQSTMAVFLATFAYALTVLRTVRAADEGSGGTTGTEEFVPRIAVTLASVLTLASVVMLALFLAHLARQLRVETMLKDVSAETVRTIRSLPQPETPTTLAAIPRPAAFAQVAAASSGFLISVDRAALVELADRFDLVIAEERDVGSSVIEGTPLAFWWPSGSPPTENELVEIEADIAKAHAVAFERTATADVGFGLRQLADVALKAVSPGVNDPTTAVHVLSHSSALLCRLVRRPPDDQVLTGEDGSPRLLRKPLDLERLLEVALEQLLVFGTSDPEVAARMLQLLREVAYANRHPELAPAIRSQLERLQARIGEQRFDGTTTARLDRLGAEVTAALEGIWRPSGAAGELLAEARLNGSGTPFR